MELTGVDVSSYQLRINWEQAKRDIDFAIIRAGANKTFDTRAKENIRACHKAGIPFGLYWASYAIDTEEAKTDANRVWHWAKDCHPEFPLIIDFEEFSASWYRQKTGKDLTKTVASDIIRAFCETIESFGGYAMFYGNPSFTQRYFDADCLKRFDYWLAHWGKTPMEKNGFNLHQYSSKGRISGISGYVDMDKCYKDYPAIMREYHLNGW